MFNSKKNNKILNDIERAEYEPIVFINKPATSYLEDVVGFKSQVETIHKAIDNGANMIGVIADYGTSFLSLVFTSLLSGSSLTEKTETVLTIKPMIA